MIFEMIEVGTAYNLIFRDKFTHVHNIYKYLILQLLN